MVEKIETFGSRAMVFHGTAKKTRGGLVKKDLMLRKGRIVSRKASAAGKKAIQRLFKLGYKPQKGKPFVKMTRKMAIKKGKKGTRKMRGGNFFQQESGSSGSM